jgi:hypothetical protein
MTRDRRLVYVTVDTTGPVDVAAVAAQVRAKHQESM